MRRIASLALILAVTVGGCSLFQRDEDPPPLRTEPPRQAAYLKETAVQPEAEEPSSTAVENALAWSEKYAQAVEQLARQQEANSKLADQNRGLETKVAALESDLAKTRQELKDANDLLIDLRRANEEWKANILGYRDELRKAHSAELEALYKVLRLLGGEVTDSTPTAASTGTTGPATGETAGDATEAPRTAAAASEGETGATIE
jgi:septal ring factor EnvC (AmiA/AmiB activator)